MLARRVSLQLDSLSLDLMRQVNRLVDRFEDELLAGRAPCAESYVNELDDPTARLVLLRLILLTERDLARRPETTRIDARAPLWMPEPDSSAEGEGGAPYGIPSIPGYEVKRELGRGGMGIVYLARQLSLNRLVALKVIHQGARDGPEARERFRREAELFARCRHPNLARIHHVGEHAGQPYLVLEYAEGGSLDRRLDGNPWPARLAADLVEPLAQAVAEVHALGIVHRDLKPANILIDADGTPMIGDFGLAKLAGEDARLTASGAVLGTPSYMSPEQAEGHAGEIGEPTDVYALGAILFELITGRPPFKGKSAVETLRQVREVEVVPPSRLRPEVPRDLETICLTCLAKDPNRRYRGAAELADDLRRFLEGRTILARRATAPERFRRWCRRNPWVAASIVLLVAGLGITSFLLWKADRAERSASRAAANAVTEAEVSRSVLAFFLEDVLGQASASVQARPGLRPDPNLQVRTALDRAAAKIPDKFAGRPAIEAAMRRTIGDSYLALGLFDQAAPHIERARELLRRERGPAHPETLEASRMLAQVYVNQDRVEDSERLIKDTLQTARRMLGDEHVDTFRSEQDLAYIYMRQERLDEAERLLPHALEGLRRLLGRGDESTLGAVQNWVELLIRRKRAAEAEPDCREMLEAQRANLGEDHPDTLSAKHMMAQVCFATRQDALGEELLKEAYEGRLKVLGPKHLNTLDAQNSLAVFYASRDHAKAEGLLVSLIALSEEVMGKEHSQTISALHNLGEVLIARRKFDEAGPVIRRLIEVRRRQLKPDQPDTLRSLTIAVDELAIFYVSQGKYAEAEPVLAEELDLRRQGLGDDHAETIQAMDSLGKLRCFALNNPAGAEPLFAEAWGRRARVDGPEHELVTAEGDCLAESQIRQEKFAEAERTLREILGARTKASPDAWETPYTQARLGTVLLGQKKYADAERALLEGFEGIEARKASVKGYEEISRRVSKWLVDLYEATGDREKADRWRRP